MGINNNAFVYTVIHLGRLSESDQTPFNASPLWKIWIICNQRKENVVLTRNVRPFICDGCPPCAGWHRCLSNLLPMWHECTGRRSRTCIICCLVGGAVMPSGGRCQHDMVSMLWHSGDTLSLFALEHETIH